jgi:hypothetical protein
MLVSDLKPVVTNKVGSGGGIHGQSLTASGEVFTVAGCDHEPEDDAESEGIGGDHFAHADGSE